MHRTDRRRRTAAAPSAIGTRPACAPGVPDGRGSRGATPPRATASRRPARPGRAARRRPEAPLPVAPVSRSQRAVPSHNPFSLQQRETRRVFLRHSHIGYGGPLPGQPRGATTPLTVGGRRVFARAGCRLIATVLPHRAGFLQFAGRPRRTPPGRQLRTPHFALPSVRGMIGAATRSRREECGRHAPHASGGRADDE